MWSERVDLADVDCNFCENLENVGTKVLIKTTEAHLLES